MFFWVKQGEISAPLILGDRTVNFNLLGHLQLTKELSLKVIPVCTISTHYFC